MKNVISIFTTAALLILFTTSLSAQEERAPKKYDNPEWKRVVYVDYHSGKAGKAFKVINNYYEKAAEKAGTPRPSLMLRMETGEYDLMIIWDLQEGVESLNWEVSPSNIKWWKAFVEVAGSEEKANAIQEEYRSYVRSGKSELVRKF
jgi:hypothetical protein